MVDAAMPALARTIAGALKAEASNAELFKNERRWFTIAPDAKSKS
jgi:hypothetical protein